MPRTIRVIAAGLLLLLGLCLVLGESGSTSVLLDWNGRKFELPPGACGSLGGRLLAGLVTLVLWGAFAVLFSGFWVVLSGCLLLFALLVVAIAGPLLLPVIVPLGAILLLIARVRRRRALPGDGSPIEPR